MDGDERVALLCAEKANYFSAAVKLLFKCCSITLNKEKEHVINTCGCEEYDQFINYEEEFLSQPVEEFYANFTFFIRENPGIFTIVGNDEWLKNEYLVINICDGKALPEQWEDCTLQIGKIYAMACSMALSEIKKPEPDINITHLRNYIRLSLIMACEAVSYDDDKRNFAAIASIIRNDLSISDKDSKGNDILAPIMGALKGIMSGIVPDTVNIPTPTMKDVTNLSGDLVSGLTKHGPRLRDAITGFRNIIIAEKGDFAGILHTMADRTNDPEVKEGISSIASTVMSNFGGIIPEDSGEGDPISRAILSAIRGGSSSNSSST